VALVANILREAAAAITSPLGDDPATQESGGLSLAVCEPLGVIAAFAPWNAPIIRGTRGVARRASGGQHRCNEGERYAAHVLLPLLVTGLGIGLIMAPAMSLATSGVATDDAGVAWASVNTMQRIGGSIGTALLNTIAASAATSYLVGKDPTDRLNQAHAALES
jgi:hypothetical protein